jgi:hypothetical protein
MGRNLDTAIPLADAARRLGLPYATVHKRLQRGTLTGVRRGGRWYVLPDELDPPSPLDPGLDAGINQPRPELDTKPDGSPPHPDTPDAKPDAKPDGTQTNLTNLDARTELLIGVLQADVEFLRGELVRKDHIIAGLTDALTRRVLALPEPTAPRYAPIEPEPPRRGLLQRFLQFWWVGA